MEKLCESPTRSPEVTYDSIFPKKVEKPTNKAKEEVTLRRKSSTGSRTNSIERNGDVQKVPKKIPTQAKKSETKISTWSGRPKSSRPSLTQETFTPFSRIAPSNIFIFYKT